MPKGREKGISRPRILASIAAAALLLVLPGGAQAATIAPSVTTDDLTNDSDCTLREAVESLNQGSLQDDCDNTGAAFGTGDTVQLAAGQPFDLTVSGDGEDGNATGDLDLLVPMTIMGNAANPPTIRSSDVDTDRTIHVPGNDSVTLQALTVDDGELDDSSINRGGNIYFQGGTGTTLTLDDVTVSSGQVTGSSNDRGGGIAADGGGSVMIENGSAISGNLAGGSVGNTFFGGGIYIGGPGTDLSIDGSTVGTNEVGTSNGATGGVGGGIFVDATGTSVIDLVDAVVTQNRAGGNAVTANQGLGGGITVFGPLDLTVTGGSITTNTAGGLAGDGIGFGGGIYLEDPNNLATATLTGVDVSLNEAGGNGGDGDGDGGGIFSQGGDLTITDSVISQNDAGFSNGAIDFTNDPNGVGGGILTTSSAALTIDGSAVTQNRAGENLGNGGGIDMGSTGADLTVTDSLITQNQAGVVGAEGQGRGGGINRDNDQFDRTDTITGSIISENTVHGFGPSRGGGINAELRGSLAIRASTISDNTVTSGNDFGSGGGLALDGNSQSGDFTLENVTVSGNTADSEIDPGGAGGGLSAGDETGPQPFVTVSHSTFNDNSAEAGTAAGGGNIFTFGAASSVSLRASIIQSGNGEATAENCDGEAGIVSLGFNVEGSPSGPASQCALTMPNDVVADPLLGALLDNGGPDPGAPTANEPLRTLAITTASPAFNRVTSGCPPPATDPRGISRPQGGACDSGAFELVVPPATGGGGQPPAQSQPPTTPRKKCKKKKRGRSAVAAKKCKKKKRK
jgi:hypothetical protein